MPVTFSAVITAEWVGALFPTPGWRWAAIAWTRRSLPCSGGRKAVSLGRAATGCGADLIVVDDLMMILPITM